MTTKKTISFALHAFNKEKEHTFQLNPFIYRYLTYYTHI